MINLSLTKTTMLKVRLDTKEIQFFSTILFIINPVLGLLTISNFLFSNWTVNKHKLINLFIVFLSLFLGFINSTKIPENDLNMYLGHFLLVEEYGFYEYLSVIQKEPLLYIFNFIFFPLLQGSFSLYIITITFISYLLFFQAIRLFFLKIKAPISLLVFGLFLAAFFPQLFSLSAHLIRQFIASSFFLYFAVNKIFYGKSKWWAAFCGVFTHGSSFLLFFLVSFTPLKKFKKNIILNILLITALASYQFIAKILLQLFGELNESVNYILKRASSETTFDLGVFPTINYFFITAIVVISFSSIKHIGKKFVKRSAQHTREGFEIDTNSLEKQRLLLENNLFFFFLVMTIFSFFIIANLNQSELSIRLFFYLFFFSPLVIPVFIYRFRAKALLSFLLSVIIIIYFINRLAFGIWTYAPLIDIATNTSFSYFFQSSTSF